MEKHITEIASIIEKTRSGDDNLLHDSNAAAIKISDYIKYHFIEIEEKADFQLEQVF